MAATFYLPLGARLSAHLADTRSRRKRVRVDNALLLAPIGRLFCQLVLLNRLVSKYTSSTR